MRYSTKVLALSSIGKAGPLFSETSADSDSGDDDKIKDQSEYLERQGEFFLVGSVNDSQCQKLAQAMLAQALQNKRKKRVFTLNVNSPGGSYDSGILLIGTLARIKSMGIKLHVRVMGEACSMAVGILQCGDLRLVNDASTIMVHDASAFHFGNSRKMSDLQKGFQDIRRSYASLFANRNTAGHIDPQWWLDNYMDGSDYYLTPREALELGLVDVIEDSFPAAPEVSEEAEASSSVTSTSPSPSASTPPSAPESSPSSA